MLYFYLLTAPHRNRVGLYYLPAAYGAFDLGWTEQKFATGMEVLQKLGLVRYDASAHVVWVETLSEVPVNPNQTKAFLTALKEVPDTPLFRPLLERLRAAGKKHLAPLIEHLEERLKNVERQEEPFRKPVGEPSAEPYGKRSVEPSEEPLGKPFRQPLTERLKEPPAEPLREPFGERLSDRLERRLSKTLPEPPDRPFRKPWSGRFTESLPEPSNEPLREPFEERLAKPFREPFGEPFPEPTAKRSGEPSGEPLSERLREPLAKPLPEPFGEPFAERLSKPFREPFAGPLPKPLNGHGEESSRSAVTAPQSPASGAFPVRETPAGPFPEPFAQPFGEPPSKVSSSPSSPPTPPSSTPPSLSFLSLPHSPGKGEERIKNKAFTGREEANGFRRSGIVGEGTETEDGTVTVSTPPSQEGVAKTENVTASELKVTQKTTNPSQEGDLWSKILSSILGHSIESKNNSGENNCKSSEIDAQKNEAQKVNNANHTRERVRENHSTTEPSAASVVELYHRLCPSLPRVKSLTGERRRNIANLLGRYGLDAIRTVFEKAEASDFLSGRNGKWRGCSLDWLIREENFVRVWEGRYDNRPPKLPKAFQSYLDYLAGKPLTPDDFPPEQARLMREYNIDPNEIFRIPGVGAVGG
ncbi:hypothetical protein [Hydrogenibacillus schlegelii]|uniref:hypothetical protein n=1 Tax=Hydrogenibacillus schlegelii TaxID=1484 RepID=UPI0023562C7F|nr:hypothetical protein [Hydrogenibacillus schlegelii]